jgi:hypothetical protein
MVEAPRYRVEDGVACIDIGVTSFEQLFDNRDPAPFRQRDLDPDLVDYLVDAAEDLSAYEAIRIVVWLPAARPSDDVTPAFRGHFEYEQQRLERSRRRQRRVGGVALVIAVIALVVLQTLARGVTRLPDNGLRGALREGLVILSWIALWRPVEILGYDWIPIRHQRRLLRHLLSATIDTRVGSGPARTTQPAARPLHDRAP